MTDFDIQRSGIWKYGYSSPLLADACLCSGDRIYYLLLEVMIVDRLHLVGQKK